MKIIHLILGKANPERANGVNVAVHFLAQELARQGEDVEVWGITKNTNDPTPLRSYPLRLFREPSRRFLASSELKEAILKLPSDSILHFHGGFIPRFRTLAKIAKSRNLEWILSPHGSYASNAIRNRNYLLKWIYLHLFERFLILNSKAIHSLNEHELSGISRFKIRTNTVTVPNGHGSVSPSDSTPIRAPHPPLTFGYLGRLAFQKGVDTLIQGFAHYKKAGGKGILRIVGEGEEKKNLESFAFNLGISSSVQFKASSFGNEKIQDILDMDIFIHISRSDGMPIAVLEAAALQRPLLLSRATHLESFIVKWKSGQILNHLSPQEISSALQHFENLFDTGELIQMGSNAGKMAREEFSWDTIAKSMVNGLYSSHGKEKCTVR